MNLTRVTPQEATRTLVRKDVGGVGPRIINPASMAYYARQPCFRGLTSVKNIQIEHGHNK